MPPRTLAALTLLAIFSASAVHASALPSCAPPVEVANVPVDRVEPNGMLVTNDGRAVKLEGVLLPDGVRDHAPQAFVQQALDMLGNLTKGHLADLAAKPPKEDRYGRLRAQVFVADDAPEPWMQAALLARGLARVSITPDRLECSNELFALESAARAKHAGIWAQAAYAVRDAASVPLSDLGTFQIVEGKVSNASVRSGRAYINFGADWRTDFTVTIQPPDMKNFRAKNIDPAAYYAGKILRVRGVIEQLNGPEIEIAAPEQIEILPDLRSQAVK